MNTRRRLFFSAVIASLGAFVASVLSFLGRMSTSGSAGWGQYGGFEFVYVGWQNSPQAPEVYFGISFTLLLILLCCTVLLSRLPRPAKAVAVAAVLLFVLNAFYIWTSDILYPQANGLQVYVVDSVLVFVSVVTGSWADFGMKFIDFGLPALAVGVGLCGMTLGKSRLNRAVGFFSWSSLAVFPLALECHYAGYGYMAVTSYLGLSKSPLHLVTNDVLLYLSGAILVVSLLSVLVRAIRPLSGTGAVGRNLAVAVDAFGQPKGEAGSIRGTERKP